MCHKQHETVQKPDGGYGWVVVAGACLTNIFNQSIVSLFGLLYGDRITTITQGSTTSVALVMNIASLFLNFSGVITGPLLKVCTTRSITMLGSFLTGIGLIASAFATQTYQFVLSYSCCVGLGLGLIIPSQFMAINEYFSTKKSRAVGLSVAGAGIGQVFMPHLVKFLLEKYGFSGTVLILGALAWNGILGGMLFQPVEWHMASTHVHAKGDQELVTLTPVHGTKNDEVLTKGRRSHKIKCSRILKQIVHMLDLKLLKDPSFLSLTIGLSLAYTASTNFSMIYPLFLQNVTNMTIAETAWSMSLLSAADLTSRLIVPHFQDRLQASSKLVFLIGLVLLICVRVVLTMVTDKVCAMVVSVMFGFVRALNVINQNLAVSEYCHKNPNTLSNALGINMTVKGIFVISLGQLLGFVRDLTQSYQMVLFAQNIVLILVVCVWIPEMIYEQILVKRRKEYLELCC